MPQYKFKFADDATTTLATGIVAASTSLQVVSGGGALFPALGAQEAFVGTLIKNGNTAIKEVVLVTARSGDNMTGLVRNYSGTGALTWNAGDTFAMLQPAEIMAVFAQLIDLQMQKLNYANDSGTSSAYRVILSPAINASVVGMPIRFMASHDNAAGCTFTDGISTAALIIPGISGLGANMMRAGGIYTATWDGSTFQLGGAQRFDMISGQLASGQVPSAVVLQWESLFSIAFSQLTGQLQNGQIASSIILPGSPTSTTQASNDSSTKLATTAFANPLSLRGSPGFQVLPSGNILQWGSANPNGGAITVTLPTSYSSSTSWAVVAMNTSGGATQVWNPLASKSASAFGLQNNGGTSFWIAVGF